MHLKQRAAICYAMVAGGVITLFSGVAMLSVGISGDQMVWFESHSIKVTAGGFGAITMLASVLWGYFAYRSRPEIRYFGPTRSLSLTREEVARGEQLRKMENKKKQVDA